MNYFIGIYAIDSRPLSGRDGHNLEKNNSKLIWRHPTCFLAVHSDQKGKNGNLQIWENDTASVIWRGKAINPESLSTGPMGTGSSDSKMAGLVASAYRRYEENAIQGIKGDYALALWDRKKGKLFLARDRVGLTPLYYAVKGNKIWFSDHLEALLDIGGLDDGPNWDYIRSYFFLDGLQNDATTEYAGIRQVRPGQVWLAGTKIFSQHAVRFWQDFKYTSEEKALDDYAKIINRAVRRQMPKNKEAVLAFSGGLDTRVILEIGRKSRSSIRTFTLEAATVSVCKREDYSLARQRANNAGADHTGKKMGVSRFMSLIGSDIAHSRRLINFNNLNIYAIFRSAGMKGDIVLSGDGTEEQLGLYPYHHWAYWADRMLERVPEFNSRILEPQLLSAYTAMLFSRSWQREGKPDGQHKIIERLFKPNILPGGFDPEEVFMSIWSRSPRSYLNPPPHPGRNSLFNQALNLDLTHNLIPKLALWRELLYQKHDIQMRLPFLDDEFIDFNYNMPAYWRLPAGTVHYKYLFRKAAARLIGPSDAFTNFKSGSDLPFEEWLLEPELERYVRSELSPAKIKKTDILDPGYVQEIIRQHYHNRSLVQLPAPGGMAGRIVKNAPNHTHKILKLLGFMNWHKNNLL